MKTLALVLFLSLNAHADDKVIQQLQLDLDGDGHADTARIVDTGAQDFYSLQVSLTGGGRELRADRLLKKWSGQTCGEFSKDTLAEGPGSTLVWQEGINTEDDMFSECRYMARRNLTFRYARGDLALASADLTSESWSMGSTAPHVTERDDFAAGTISLHVTEHKEFNVDRRRTEKMKPACGATLTQLNDSGYPVCASLQSAYMYAELFPEDSDQPAGTPPCPALDGAYQCSWRYDGAEDLFHDSVLVIHRVENRTHRYDVSSDNALVADGKTRLVKSDETSRVYQTTTCRRERLVTDENTTLLLGKGDPRKPLFDRRFWQKRERVWTQLDLEGKHFSLLETEETLEDKGGYRASKPRRFDCVKSQ